jgi:hypothetical protein
MSTTFGRAAADDQEAIASSAIATGRTKESIAHIQPSMRPTRKRFQAGVRDLRFEI